MSHLEHTPPAADATLDRVTRFVLGDMGPAEASAFEQDLPEQPEVAAEVEALKWTLALLPHAVEAEPPRLLRTRVLEAAAQSVTATPRPPVRVGRPADQVFARRWLPAAAAVAVAALAGLVVDDVRLRRELTLHKEASLVLQQPNVVLSFAMEGRGDAPAAFGRVILDLDGKKGAAVMRALPELPEGQVYRLWAQVGAKLVFCGQFRSSADERVISQFAVPVDAYTEPVARLVLTVEGGQASPKEPVGPTVMEGRLG